MIQRLKGYVIERLPAFSAAIHSYRCIRWLRQGKAIDTQYGFKLSGRKDMQDGSFEKKGVELVIERSGEFEVFVDVGANIGYYTCLARKIGKRTVAVEPHSRNLLCLYDNLRVNSWDDVEVFPVALLDKPGITTLYGEDTGASLIRHWARQTDRWSQSIAVSTLDIILGERFAGQRLLIKIDVEGSEMLVLKGASRTLERKPPPVWIVEVSLAEHHPDGINPHFREIFELFRGKGYSARPIERVEPVADDEVQAWFTDHRTAPANNCFIFEK